jgi:hypothetical protein
MFKNIWTTLAGIGAGGLNLLANGTKWQQVLFSSGLAVFGLLAKDYDTTGVGQSAKKE